MEYKTYEVFVRQNFCVHLDSRILVISLAGLSGRGKKNGSVESRVIATCLPMAALGRAFVDTTGRCSCSIIGAGCSFDTEAEKRPSIAGSSSRSRSRFPNIEKPAVGQITVI